MKVLFYTFLIFICYHAKAQDIAILPDTASVSLNSDELQLIQTLLENSVHQYNTEAGAKEKINLSNYKRQYVVSFNSKGEKEVWVNCFCDAWGKDWKKELVIVKDGGECYFQMKVNLATKKGYDMFVNGKA